MTRRYVAIDLGAGSGRVILGQFGDDRLDLDVLHRFPHHPHRTTGHERWDIGTLFDGIKTGLRRLPHGGRGCVSLGVDTWGVDYGLFDAAGRLLEDPVCYRDGRTEGVVDRVLRIIPRAELFRATGLQILPFNTLYQLVAQRDAGEWPQAATSLLMMPDIFHYYLSGQMIGEVTLASTTQLLSAESRQWVAELFERLALPRDVMPALVQPGTMIGTLKPELQRELDLQALRIVAPATHDTASAIVGTPLADGWAYLSSGTWSLLGIETHDPLLTEAVVEENLTNEGGAERTNRLLKNIAGLWILESCRNAWAAEGTPLDHETLAREVEAARPLQAFLVPDDPRLFNPEHMPSAVRDVLRATGQDAPDDPMALTRIIFESLALRYASVIRRIERVTGRRLRGIRIIGGGSQNQFLNQATADAANLEVRAGPVEATALGNLMVQAIADGRFANVEEARAFVERHLPGARCTPQRQPAWAEARERYARLEAEIMPGP